MEIYEVLREIQGHIAVLNDDYTQMAADVAVLKSQINELIWCFKAIATAFIVLIVTQFWQVLIMEKKNKKK